MSEEIQNRVIALAEPLVKQAGLAIWGLQITGRPPRNVTLFVDSPRDGAKPGETPPATIDQCEDISRQLGLALEVEDIFPGPWTLEVSTPGLERRFFNMGQMAPYVGDLVEARLFRPIPAGPDLPGRAAWKGRLLETGPDFFVLEPCQVSDNGEILPERLPPCRIEWSNCKQARRAHVFAQPKKPGKSPSRKKSQ